MKWHDISDPGVPELDDLAASYGLHPLHIEDARNGAQRTKTEAGPGYLFLILKILSLDGGKRLTRADLSLFVGRDFLITVHSGPVPLLHPLRGSCDSLRTDEVLHRVMDGVVESYVPILEHLEDVIEGLHDLVIDRPRPGVLEELGEVRGDLLELRRVLSATRHVASQLHHSSSPLIGRELHPFLRDIHDDLAIMLDTIAGERDRLASVLDIYFSSVANRTTEATWTLTLLGTIVLPTLVITGIFGMSIEYPRWTRSHWFFGWVLAGALLMTVLLFWLLGRRDYPSRGNGRSDRGREAIDQATHGVDGATRLRRTS